MQKGWWRRERRQMDVALITTGYEAKIDSCRFLEDPVNNKKQPIRTYAISPNVPKANAKLYTPYILCSSVLHRHIVLSPHRLRASNHVEQEVQIPGEGRVEKEVQILGDGDGTNRLYDFVDSWYWDPAVVTASSLSFHRTPCTNCTAHH